MRAISLRLFDTERVKERALEAAELAIPFAFSMLTSLTLATSQKFNLAKKRTSCWTSTTYDSDLSYVLFRQQSSQMRQWVTRARKRLNGTIETRS